MLLECSTVAFSLTSILTDGAVVGTVHAGPDAIANARLTLFEPDLSFFAEVRSEANGAFEFGGVPAGEYSLGVAAIGFDYQEIDVDIGLDMVDVDFNLDPETHPGEWNVIGTTLPEFLDATDIGLLLPDGRIFYCHDTTDPILFDPATGAKVFPAGSGSPQGCMNGTLLPDGDPLMVGGQDGADPGNFTNAIPWVKSYDIDTDEWTEHADLQHKAGRWYPGLARFADGSMIAMGGGTAPNAERTDTCELLDLATMEWTYTGSLLNPSEFTPAALLYTGEVLATWWPAQLFDPEAEEWRATGQFQQPNRLWPGHSDHSLVVLADGRVAAIGVIAGPDENSDMVEIYDPATETWSVGSNPDLIRLQAEVAQLPDGRVFVGGGETEDPDPPVEDVLGIVKWTDLYDPIEDTWRRVADVPTFREYHGVTLLVPDGRVVVTGGTRIKFQVGPTSADIEAYSPPYLFRGVQPQIVSISDSTVRRGSTLEFEIFPDTQITSVVLMGLPAQTHWVNAGVRRRLVLQVEQNGVSVSATVPDDPNVSVLGSYMAFAMVDDIPSEAVVVRVEPACAADVNNDGELNILDFVAFQSLFQDGDPEADCNGDGGLDVLDFVCFQGKFVEGC